MLTTTYNLAKKAYACSESLNKAVRHYGGVERYGADTPTPLTEIADICGIDDALWCLRCTREKAKTRRLARLLAADFAEHVLPLIEKKYPSDDRPRKAIEAARLFARGKIKAAARAAARDAAWAAARDAARVAAWDAAWDAAGAAAWAAEREWQLKRFKEVLEA